MASGTVKWFNDQKGFGFITGDDGKDCFVHFSGIVSHDHRKTLHDGQRVSYELKATPKGPQAFDVRGE